MRNLIRHRTTGCRASRMAWGMIAAAALLAGCASQPKNAPPPEQAAEPPEAQAAEVGEATVTVEQDAGATPPESAAPPTAPTAVSAAPAQPNAASANRSKDEPGRRVAGQTVEDRAARPTTATQTPDSQEPPAEKVKPTRAPSVDQSEPARAGAAPAKSPLATADAKQPPPKKPQPPTKPEEKPAADAAGCGAKGAGVPTPSPTGPQPQWVCSEPKCVVESVWRGQQAEFVFTIGNEGEGDLHFRLKCG